MISIEPYSEANHYALISTWWQGHGWPSMPAHKLPPLGFVVLCGDKPVAAAFAYLDNGGTGVAMLEWTVGDPQAEPKTVLKALKVLFPFMVGELNKLDYDVIFTSCRQQGLARIYEKCGFLKTDEGMTHLVHIKGSE